MNIITIDYETYYDREYSLSKITTEEYVRSDLFEVIGVAVKVNGGKTEWFSGTHEETKQFLEQYDWANSVMLAQNTMFDGAIHHWRFGLKAKAYFDTMLMSYCVDGVHERAGLAKLAERYGVGAKGTEVVRALGKRRKDFSPQDLHAYAQYCIQDVDLTYAIAKKMIPRMPRIELKVIDLTLRMFIEPVLELDLLHLENHLYQVKERKQKLLDEVGLDKKELMSNNKFAEQLRALGVEPPMKISLTTGKETYAFAKTDAGFNTLLEHENDAVQALANARAGNKSTLEETRTERFIGIAKRGNLPVPLKYHAAHTGRYGGQDKVNLQNLPSRGPNGKVLKKALIAPEGYKVIACDSSQIEARILAWLAGQQDLVDAFARDEDVYKDMASRIYSKPISEVDKSERFVGKTTILGCGYQMGGAKFKDQARTMGVELSEDEAKRIVKIYRDTNPHIKQLWYDAQTMLKCMVNGESFSFGRKGVLTVNTKDKTIVLPTGITIRYVDLEAQQTEMGYDFSYHSREGRKKIYGGKVIENVTQALARCILVEQMLIIAKRYRVVSTVHDEIIVVAPEAEIEEATQFVGQSMLYVPEWAEGVPLACEAGYADSYGACGDIEIKFTRADLCQ